MNDNPNAARLISRERSPEFPDTRWSAVLAAQAKVGRDSEAALEQLCRDYWYPIYAFVRRGGSSPEDAEDATQGFFADLLRRDSLRTATPEMGRLRSFLLAALKNFITSQWRKDHALKRGGGSVARCINAEHGERRLAAEPSHEDTPEALYDRSWAYSVLESTLGQLRDYYGSLGKAELFAEMEPCLFWNERSRPYAAMAAKLQLSEPALRFAVHKMRRRYQSLLRRLITDTVATHEDAEEEIRHLCAVLAGQR